MSEAEGRLSPDRAIGAARSNLLKVPVITLLGLASTVVVVRVLAPEVFALYALATALRMTLQLLTDLGTGAASARLFGELEQAHNGTQARQLFGRLVLIRICMVGVLAAGLFAFSDFFSEMFSLKAGEQEFLAFLGLLAASEVLGALGFYVLTGTFRQDTANKAQLLYSFLQPVLVIVAAASGLGLAGVLMALLVASYARSTVLTARSIIAIWSIPREQVQARPIAHVFTRVATSTLVGKLASWVHSRQVVTVFALSAQSRPLVAVFAVAYDFVHQALLAVAGLFYNLLLPAFVSRSGDRAAMGRLLRRSFRVLAIAILPVAATLMASYPSLSMLLFGEAYDASIKYAMVIFPAVAVELVISGPCTNYMTADDLLLSRYRNIKAATLPVAATYVVLVDESLLAVTAVMMLTRVASTLALYATIKRQTGLDLEGPWLLRFGLLCVGMAVGGVASSLVVPGHAADLPIVIVAAVLFGVTGARLSGLLRHEDLALVARVLPEVAPLTQRVASWVGVRQPS